MKTRRALPFLLLLGLAAGCASSSPPGLARIEPDQTVEYEGNAYQLRRVQGDYVLLRYQEPGAGKGAISGFVDEVFRISRYDLGEGRWYATEKHPGLYLQWLGLDSFALARDAGAVGGAEVVMVR